MSQTCRTCRHWNWPYQPGAPVAECLKLRAAGGETSRGHETWSIESGPNTTQGQVIVQKPLMDGVALDPCVPVITEESFGCVHHEERQ